MAVYLVAYDLNVPGQDYSLLIEQLRKFPHFHAQLSLWFIEGAGPPSALRDALRPYYDSSARLFIDEVSDNSASFNMPTCTKWLNERGL